METEKLSRSGVEDAESLARELKNFQEIASHIKAQPGDIPNLGGFDIYGLMMPLNGVVGGDHIIYSDFKTRYDLDARIELARERGQEQVSQNLVNRKRVAGIALVDVSGHRVTDALLAGHVPPSVSSRLSLRARRVWRDYGTALRESEHAVLQ